MNIFLFPVDYSGLTQSTVERCQQCWCCSNCARACDCEVAEEEESDSDIELRVLGVKNNLSVISAEKFRASFVLEEEKLFGEEELEEEEDGEEVDED